MRLSAKAEYACLAVLELALWYQKKKPLQMRVISSRYGIPVKYLVQVLTQLKDAGIVTSKRGVSGGYMLVKPPAKVTLADVIRIVEGPPLKMKTSESSLVDERTRSVFLGFKAAWQRVMDETMKVLEKVSYEEICRMVREKEGGMYYI